MAKKKKWEYKLVETEIGNYKGQDCTKPFLNEINRLGKEGWEAIQFQYGKITYYTRPVAVLFKRPLAQ